MSNWGLFLEIVLGITILFFLGSKIKVSVDQRTFAKSVTSLAIAILKNTDFKYKEQIEKICENIKASVDALDDYYGCLTTEQKVNAIKENTLKLCESNGMIVDNDLNEAVMEVIVFLVNSGLLKI